MKAATYGYRRSAITPVLGVLALVVFASCQRKAPEVQSDAPLRIQAEVARAESLANRILTAAQVEAAAWQPLYFGSSGKVERVLVTENQQVKKGQLLAELETESQTNQVEKSRLSLERSQMDEEQALHDFQNVSALLESGGASQEQVHDQEQRYLEAKLQRQQSELGLASQEIRLEEMRLRAPFDSILSEVNIRVGDLVHGDVSDPDRDMNMRPPMVAIDPNSQRVLRAHLPEGRAGQVEKGTPTEIVLMEHREIVLEGEVIMVSDVVDRDTRTVIVEIAVARPHNGYPNELRDGSAALVTLFTERRENAVTVSEYALYYYQDQAYVFVVDAEGRVERRPVTLGLIEGGRVEMKTGLSAGDRVAHSHLYLLRDGQTVLTEDTP